MINRLPSCRSQRAWITAALSRSTPRVCWNLSSVDQARTITELHEKVQEQELEINELLQRAYRNRSERYREGSQTRKSVHSTGIRKNAASSR
ncbi:MAG: hypothetical protein RBS80_07140 [Thermoguttaceae bacterium]|jgi:disulfide oxidoreductase YuzD|nr:hypothetical protein [Thermoguttaceae bacterium]